VSRFSTLNSRPSFVNEDKTFGCTADTCDALLATRPYRPGLPAERTLEIMGREVGAAIDSECFEAMHTVLAERVLVREGDPPAVQLVGSLAEDYEPAA
jgi:HD-GYP domain-containing protein (c-di-GMP phosphodiesterase class II)